MPKQSEVEHPIFAEKVLKDLKTNCGVNKMCRSNYKLLNNVTYQLMHKIINLIGTTDHDLDVILKMVGLQDTSPLEICDLISKKTTKENESQETGGDQEDNESQETGEDQEDNESQEMGEDQEDNESREQQGHQSFTDELDIFGDQSDAADFVDRVLQNNGENDQPDAENNHPNTSLPPLNLVSRDRDLQDDRENDDRDGALQDEIVTRLFGQPMPIITSENIGDSQTLDDLIISSENIGYPRARNDAFLTTDDLLNRLANGLN